MTERKPWSHKVGARKASVTVYEDPKRKSALYLRWRDREKNNWKRESLGRILETDARGKITEECEAFAIGAAQQKSLQIASGVVGPLSPEKPKATTIADAEALITNPDTGKYPHPSPFRDELVRALRLAVVLWGGDTPWTAIEESHYTMLLRRRLEALVAKQAKGVRATEITLSRLVTVVRWLRRTRHIPRDAAPWPDEWKLEVTRHWKGVTHSDRDPQPDRPRYTIEEAKRIIAAADFDPRLDMLVRLSIGLRPGQAARARRSDLELPPVDWTAAVDAKDETDYGTFTVYGAGKKGGVIVDLTRGQRLAVDHALTGTGYLNDIERKYRAGEAKDYALFPSGYIVGRVALMRGKESSLSLSKVVDFGRAVTGSWIRKGWRVAEQRAQVEHVHGRATYGFRRLAVDVADELGLSPAGLQATGGWIDSKIPTTIYRERGNKAGRREARAVRSAFLEDMRKNDSDSDPAEDDL
jgi:hypothetical protein